MEYFDHPVSGRVTQTIQSNRLGQVFCDGTYWRAKLAGWMLDELITLSVGDQVAVVGRQGNILVVSTDWINGL